MSSICTVTPCARCSPTPYLRDTEDASLPQDPRSDPTPVSSTAYSKMTPYQVRGQALNLPKKQRHTAKRIHERLRDEYGFDGGYTIVKDYVRKHRRRTREMFVPLVHPPGHAQCDFGEAWAVIGGVKQKIHFFVLDLPHSDAMFVRAYPRRDHRGVLRRTRLGVLVPGGSAAEYRVRQHQGCGGQDTGRRSQTAHQDFHRACVALPFRGQVRSSRQGQRQGEGGGYGRVHQTQLPGAHPVV